MDYRASHEYAVISPTLQAGWARISLSSIKPGLNVYGFYRLKVDQWRLGMGKKAKPALLIGLFILNPEVVDILAEMLPMTPHLYRCC